MTNKKMRLVGTVLLLGTSASVVPRKASAQDLGRMTERTFYATLVSGTDEVSKKPVVVIRRPSAVPHDVILVDLQRATPSDLGAALEVLEHLKAQNGDSVEEALRAAPSGSLRRPFRDGEEQRLRLYLSYLTSAPVQNVPEIGWAHTTALTVPREAFADKLEPPSRRP